MGVNREKAYDAVLVALKGPNPVGSLDHMISLQERVLDLEAELQGIIEQACNTNLCYYGTSTGYNVQFGTDQVERLKVLLEAK